MYEVYFREFGKKYGYTLGCYGTQRDAQAAAENFCSVNWDCDFFDIEIRKDKKLVLSGDSSLGEIVEWKAA